MNRIVSLVCGIIFGIGLTISQMINPAKVLGFLNIFGDWDPSLAFVMIGALIISSPSFYLFKNNKKPIFAKSFTYSTNKELNKKLIIGSALFGAGWGLAGLCPWSCDCIPSFIKCKFCNFCISHVCWLLFS